MKNIQASTSNIQRSTKPQTPKRVGTSARKLEDALTLARLRRAARAGESTRWIEAGGFQLVQMTDGGFWLNSPQGDGLQTSVEKIAELLAAFYRREF